MLDVQLLDAAFDPGEELTRFAARVPDAGAVVSFLGQVRAEADVLALDIRHYAPMTEPGFRALAETATQRWQLDGVLIVHRIGEMAPGAPIVMVAGAARHRRDAFAATDFVMDHLKGDVWLWKRERTASGWRWIEPREQDHIDRARWY